jgi:SPP1 family predicted phage head-tail adaptor
VAAVKIGDLRDQIVVKRAELTSDGMGGYTEAEKTKLTAWARVDVPRSKTGVIAQQDTEIRTHEITIRYSDIPQIGDIVEVFSDRLVVMAVRHDPLRKWSFLDCEPEVV